MDESALLVLQQEIVELEQLLADKRHHLEEARNVIKKQAGELSNVSPSKVNKYSPSEIKIALFRSLFKGRDDVYAKRFESKKTNNSGYQPVCRNEWVQGICEKPKTKCGNCTQRSFEPVTDEVIRNHLTGYIPAKNEWGNVNIHGVWRK